MIFNRKDVSVNKGSYFIGGGFYELVRANLVGCGWLRGFVFNFDSVFLGMLVSHLIFNRKDASVKRVSYFIRDGFYGLL